MDTSDPLTLYGLAAGATLLLATGFAYYTMAGGAAPAKAAKAASPKASPAKSTSPAKSKRAAKSPAKSPPKKSPAKSPAKSPRSSPAPSKGLSKRAQRELESLKFSSPGPASRGSGRSRR